MMYRSANIAGVAALAFCLMGVSASASHAVTVPAQSAGMVMRAADTGIGSGGIQTWIKLIELDGKSETEKPARTLFVPSDEAFAALPPETLATLLAPGQAAERRAFLSRAGTATRISPEALAGQRITVRTLDDRLLVIDDRGGETLVGDAEALDIRELPDGRVLFVLDHATVK